MGSPISWFVALLLLVRWRCWFPDLTSWPGWSGVSLGGLVVWLVSPLGWGGCLTSEDGKRSVGGGVLAPLLRRLSGCFVGGCSMIIVAYVDLELIGGLETASGEDFCQFE